MVLVRDPTDIPVGCEPHYYYHYLKMIIIIELLGSCSDGLPSTNDEVLPNIEITPNSSVGLLIYNSRKNGL
ncbi:hypothetical protein DFP79_3608 [Marinomonas balearica]|uniref:Uncharacterized protein n=1 Tax=Marinomonas balearica TaxID=491947 RepID=A0A4R6M292_9GAMM|nr:hypothetical protein DFP79_3608 [Marinomonas balearica]